MMVHAKGVSCASVTIFGPVFVAFAHGLCFCAVCTYLRGPRALVGCSWWCVVICIANNDALLDTLLGTLLGTLLDKLFGTLFCASESHWITPEGGVAHAVRRYSSSIKHQH